MRYRDLSRKVVELVREVEDSSAPLPIRMLYHEDGTFKGIDIQHTTAWKPDYDMPSD